ncbi:MAG: hypothetical protein AB7P76_11695 [Candidatus Melainabacteria bacterium]
MISNVGVTDYTVQFGKIAHAPENSEKVGAVAGCVAQYVNDEWLHLRGNDRFTVKQSGCPPIATTFDNQNRRHPRYEDIDRVSRGLVTERLLKAGLRHEDFEITD